MTVRAWWARFKERHIVHDESWDLYIFPGGKVGWTSSPKEAIRWTSERATGDGERRAISRDTGEHIVNGRQL
jgi:hypothetical protein